MAKEGKRRVAVIGAGLAGLVAAHRLVRDGVDVVVFEKDHRPGGRARTIEKDGFHLNLGAHALYTAGATYKYLTASGVEIAGAPPRTGRPIAVFGRKSYALPLSLGGVLSCRYLGVSEKFAFISVLSSLPKLISPQQMAVSLADWLAKNIRSPRVRQTIEAFVRLSTYGNNPVEMSAGRAFAQLVLAQQGVLYLDHGWQSMVDGLRQKISDRAHFKFSAAVQSVEQKTDYVEVVVDDIKEQFDAAFLCIPPDEASKLMPAAFASVKLVHNKIACLDVCLKRLPMPKNTFALGIDEPLYFSVHSAAAKLAPAGGALVHLGYYLPDGEQSDNAQAHEKRLTELLDQLQPGWEKEVVSKRFLPHMVASYGLPGAAVNGASGLQGPAVPGCPGVFVCGDYVGNGSQLADCATSSALAAAELFRKSSSACADRRAVV